MCLIHPNHKGGHFCSKNFPRLDSVFIIKKGDPYMLKILGFFCSENTFFCK